MIIPTEPIGGIPRPLALIEALKTMSGADPRLEMAGEVRDRMLEAVGYISIAQLGMRDDGGFSPFCDDVSATRGTAFQKIRMRVAGTALAEKIMGAR